jgi:serine/threonine protein kinase
VVNEVKHLASFDHKNIVNYNQAWFEPCTSSMEEEEEEEKDDFSFSPGECSFESSFTSDDQDTFQEEEEETIQTPSISWKEQEPHSPIKKILTPIFNQKKSKFEMNLYIQMQLCSSETLETWLWSKERLEGGADLSLDLIHDYFKQILEGVSHIHQKDCIHRDLKPSNIFIFQKYSPFYFSHLKWNHQDW